MKNPSIKKSNLSKSIRSETAVQDSAFRERIERKAYELYEKRGSSHGLDTEDWLEAERLVLAEIQKENKAMPQAVSKTETEPKAKTPLRGKAVPSKPGSVSGRPGSA